jgi:hypothetical protein
MDLLALIGAIFEVLGGLPGGRVTVKDRYEMKKRIRELKKRERQKAAPRTPS